MSGGGNLGSGNSSVKPEAGRPWTLEEEKEAPKVGVSEGWAVA